MASSVSTVTSHRVALHIYALLALAPRLRTQVLSALPAALGRPPLQSSPPRPHLTPPVVLFFSQSQRCHPRDQLEKASSPPHLCLPGDADVSPPTCALGEGGRREGGMEGGDGRQVCVI